MCDDLAIRVANKQLTPSVAVQYFPVSIPFDVQRLDVPNIALRFLPNLFSLGIDKNEPTTAIETNDYR